jgi:hypothetical protein
LIFAECTDGIETAMMFTSSNLFPWTILSESESRRAGMRTTSKDPEDVSSAMPLQGVFLRACPVARASLKRIPWLGMGGGHIVGMLRLRAKD